MAIEAELSYDHALVVRGVNSHWRSVVDFRFWFALCALTACIGLLVLNGDDSWRVGALAAVLVFSVTILVSLYFHQRRSALSRLRAMEHTTVSFSANDAGFTLRSSLGATSLPWSGIKSISRFPGFWLLYVSRSQFFTLPLADLPDGASDFIAGRVAEAGGRNGTASRDS